MTRRRWTAQDQAVAEVAAACGVPISHVGKLIDRSSSMIMRHLVAWIAERDRASSLQRMNALRLADPLKVNEARKKRRLHNLESYRAREQRYRDRNKDKLKERANTFYHANKPKILAARSKWRKENKNKVSEWNKISYLNRRDQRIAYSKAYYAVNKSRAKQLRRLHYLANLNKYREYNQKRLAARTPEQKKADYQRGLQWRTENRDRLIEKRKEHYNKNKKEILAKSKEYRKANKENLLRYQKAYYEQHKDKYFARARRRAYLKRSSRIRALHQLTIAAENARFALWRNRCAFCGVGPKHPRNHGYARLTTEHVMALSKHGLDEADNIMPACSSCNKSKGDRPIEAWYCQQEFFTEARWRKICRHCPAAVIGQLPLALPPGDEEAA